MVAFNTQNHGQSYALLLPTLKKRALVFRSNQTDFFNNPPKSWIGLDESHELFHNLARVPRQPIDCVSLAGLRPQTGAGGSRLEQLPLEIFFMILQDPQLGERDAVAVGLCSRTLWADLLSHLFNNCRAPWAGVPILCLGTWLKDLPDGISSLCPEVLRREPHQHFLREKFNTLCKAVNTNGEHIYWAKLLERGMWRDDTPAGIRPRLFRGLDAALGTREPLMGGWVLKNLDTREFVRLEVQHHPTRRMAFAVLEGHPWVSLDAALLYKTTIPGEGTADRDGEWAGHRFEITSRRHPRAGTVVAEGWIDYTYALARDCGFLVRRAFMAGAKIMPGFFFDGVFWWDYWEPRDDDRLQALHTDHAWLMHWLEHNRKMLARGQM